MRIAAKVQPKSAPAPPAPALAPSRGFGTTADVHPAVLRPSTGGSPLPPPIQAKMEGALGHDFSNVRVHHGPEAESIGARAFARGSHVHFAPGQYRPHSAEGQRILAHELAHVVQQRAGEVRSPGGAVPINDDARLEGEADAAGARATRGGAREPAPAAEPAGVPARGPGGAGPIQGKFVVRDGKLTEVDDDYALQEGEHPFESLRLHPRAAEFLQEHGEADPQAEKNASAIINRERDERKDELNGMQNRGLVAARTADLFRTRFRTPEAAPEEAQEPVDVQAAREAEREQIRHMFSMRTGSATHNARTRSVASDLMGRMLRNNAGAGLTNHVRHLAGIQPLRRAPEAESARLNVEYHGGSPPSYDRDANTISLMDRRALDQAGHELQHAHDHIGGHLDLNLPAHRLYSEQLAFQQQDTVSRERYGASPQMFAGRTPQKMARSYEGKVAKGYPGTLDQSRAAVDQWRRAQPVPRTLNLPKPVRRQAGPAVEERKEGDE